MSDEYRLIHALQLGPEQQRNIPLSFFQEKLGLTAEAVKGKTVLIAGCGLGNELRAVMDLKPALTVAIDLSSFIHVARDNNPVADFARADILLLPFKDETFDLVLNAGVMHHVSNPQEGFQEIHRVTKRGGTISIGSIYPPHDLNLWITRARDRYQFHKWPDQTKAIMALRWRLRLQISAERIGLGSLSERLLDIPMGEQRFPYRVRLGNVLDLYLPHYRHVIHPAEVRKWFRELGIEPKLPSNLRRFFDDARDEDFGSPAQNVGIKV